MPELPDITVYTEVLRPRVVGATLARLIIRSPFLLRTIDPPPEAVEGRAVLAVSRLGKRIVLHAEGGLFLVLHLMIAGRLLWKPPGARPASKIDLAALAFERAGARDGTLPPGTLVLTEASTKKRAGLWLVRGEAALAAMNPGGLDVLGCSEGEFAAALRRENRTLKRALTSPRTFDGIGNAYSDEILHAARLSPVALTGRLDDGGCAALHAAARRVLLKWTDELRGRFGLGRVVGGGTDNTGRFPRPGEITAFRPGFAVHGRYREPCPVCGAPVQRIVYAEHETNYCPVCQNGGRLLADRSLSRLLRDDWPRTIEEWEGASEV